MAVYVDDARIRWRGRRWSHLVANSAEELHAAAAALGIPRRGAQQAGQTLHYDLPEEWRMRAIESGVAEPISWRELARRRGLLAGATEQRDGSSGPSLAGESGGGEAGQGDEREHRSDHV